MANEVKLPRLGQGMESGTIVKWLKAEGEPVEEGEPLYELDTDKVTQEVEADASGVLLKIAVREGEVEVGKTIALIGEAGEETSSESADSADGGERWRTAEGEPRSDGAPQSAEKPAEAPQREGERHRGRAASVERETAPADVEAPRERGERIKASPLARRIARERGIDLAALSGTGPEGRVVAEDVERAASAAPAAPAEDGELEQLSTLRRTIARRLTEAWQAPAFQISMSADMSRALALRSRLVELGTEPKPTVTDVLTKVCAVALLRHRAVNAHYEREAVRLFGTANIGLAVAVPRGLIVPVLRNCERRSIAEIAGARAGVVERTRAGTLQQEDLEGGTFTISNLGMYGVDQFVAVLNPPQAAILAVGAIEDKPVVEAGEVTVRPLMTLTLTCDHRAIDGATASEFLSTVKALLEEPGLAL